MKLLFHWTIAQLLYLCLASYRMSNFVRKVSVSTQNKAFSFACIRQCAMDDACAATNVLLKQLSCTYLNRSQWKHTITFDEIIYVKFPQPSTTTTVPTTTIRTTTSSTPTTTTVPTTATSTTTSTTTTTTTIATPAFTTCQNGGSWADGSQTTCTCVPSFAGTFCERYWDDCAEGVQLGVTSHGVYSIHPRNFPYAFTVYCKMIYGGRTYIQRQAAGIQFRRTWLQYKTGFGVSSGDHWLSLDKIKAISDLNHCRLFIQMMYNSPPTWKQTALHFFKLTSESDGYRLYYKGTSNPLNSKNALPRIMGELNGSRFSTYDQDNDASASNCADTHGSGWWFNNCTPCNPNGKLRPIRNTISGNLQEIFWTGEERGTKSTFMALVREQ